MLIKCVYLRPALKYLNLNLNLDLILYDVLLVIYCMNWSLGNLDLQITTKEEGLWVLLKDKKINMTKRVLLTQRYKKVYLPVSNNRNCLALIISVY